MLKRNVAALIFTLISVGLLYPGLTLPILQISIGAELPILGKTTFYEQTQSIIETVKTLYENDNEVVAGLIFLFSVIVPFAKAVIILVTLSVKEYAFKNALYKFVSVIGKWSMADVFVVGVFIAYLSTQSNSAIEAKLLEGFNYFAAYCVVSLIGIQLAIVQKK